MYISAPLLRVKHAQRAQRALCERYASVTRAYSARSRASAVRTSVRAALSWPADCKEAGRIKGGRAEADEKEGEKSEPTEPRARRVSAAHPRTRERRRERLNEPTERGRGRGLGRPPSPTHQQRYFCKHQQGYPPPQVRASGHIGVCRGYFRYAVAKIALPYYLTAGRMQPRLTRVYSGKHEEHIFVNTSTNVYPNVHTLLQMYIQMANTNVKGRRSSQQSWQTRRSRSDSTP